MIIKISEHSYNLNNMLEYNSNYLPEYVKFDVGNGEERLYGEDAANFNKCAGFYLDYMVGSFDTSKQSSKVYDRWLEIHNFLIGENNDRQTVA